MNMDNTIAETRGLTGLLEKAVNAAVSLDPEFPHRLSVFEGKCMQVDVPGLGYRVFITVAGERLLLSKMPPERADVVIRGAPLSLLRMLISGNPAAAIQTGDVAMTGDADLGRQFNAVLGELDIDWEELLARRVGDVAAHKLGNLARGFLDWRRNAHASFAASLGEYLQEEIRHLPARIEVENFMNDADELREAADRLEARVGRLL